MALHCAQNAKVKGNPKYYSTYVDEALNKIFIKIAATCHRLTFEKRLHAKYAGWQERKQDDFENFWWEMKNKHYIDAARHLHRSKQRGIKKMWTPSKKAEIVQIRKIQNLGLKIYKSEIWDLGLISLFSALQIYKSEKKDL